MKTKISNIVVRILAAILSVSFATLCFPSHGYANSADESYEVLLQQIGNSYGRKLSTEFIDKGLTEESHRTGKSKLSLAREVFQAAQDTAIDKSLAYEGRYATRGAGTPKKHNNLADAQNVGDIFYSENSTFDFNHGHVGIFVARDYIVEAQGDNLPAHHVKRTQSVAVGTAYLYYVTVSSEARKKAAARALMYKGRDYNPWIFLPNKNDNGALNCGQLVWSAYYYGAGIDISGNPLYAHPLPIKVSPYLKQYRTIPS